VKTGVRVRVATIAACVLSCSLTGRTALAEPPQGQPPQAQPSDEEGKQHFKSGVGLFRDGNFAGALAEFEESFRVRPGASALQNIALCQRQLFRYAAAIGTLEKMLGSYGAALSSEDKSAAEQTLKELRERVTRVVFVVTPKQAALLVDGKALEGTERRSIVLDVGEHRVVLSAPGFADLDRRITVAGAEKEVPLGLEAASGTLNVTTDDLAASIVVDGATVGTGSWSGSLTAGDRHVVRVEKPGHAVAVVDVIVKIGESRDVKLVPGPRVLDGDAAGTPRTAAGPAVTTTGFYGFATATLYALGQHPDGFKTVNDKAESGGYFGLRGGYRLTSRWGLEAAFEGGTHTVGPGCYRYPDEACKEKSLNEPYYDLTAYRLGLGGRYFSKGTSLRFVATGTLGLAYHVFSIKPADPIIIDEKQRQPAGGRGSAANAFFMGEMGVEIPIGRALVDIVAVASVDGMSNLRVNDEACAKLTTPCDNAVYNGNKTVTMAGIGIRVGYGRW
jgi:hypothetical protein